MLMLSFGPEDSQSKKKRKKKKKLGLPLPNYTLSDDFLWGPHEGCLVLTLQMTPNPKPQHSFL